MSKSLLVNWVVLIIALAAVFFWCDHRVQMHAARIVAEQEQKDLEFWKTKLLPLYQEMGVKHNSNPQTRDDIFGPLLKTLKPAQD